MATLTVLKGYDFTFLSDGDYQALTSQDKSKYRDGLLFHLDEIKLDIKTIKKDQAYLKSKIARDEKLIKRHGLAKGELLTNYQWLQKVQKAYIYNLDSKQPDYINQTRVKTFYQLYPQNKKIILTYLNVTWDEFLTFNTTKLLSIKEQINNELTSLGNQVKTKPSVKDPGYQNTVLRQRAKDLAEELTTYLKYKEELLNYLVGLPRIKQGRDKSITFLVWLWLAIKDFLHMINWRIRNFFLTLNRQMGDKISYCYQHSKSSYLKMVKQKEKIAHIEEYLIHNKSGYEKGAFIDFDYERRQINIKKQTANDLLALAKDEDEKQTLLNEVNNYTTLLTNFPPVRKQIERREKTSYFFKKWGKALLYLWPVIILLSIFSFYPIVNSFRLSFMIGYDHASGSYKSLSIYQNFRDVVISGNFIRPQGDTPASAMFNTFFMTFVSVPISIILSLSIAAALSSIKRLKSFFQTIFFLPYITNSLAIGLVFAYIFQDKGGLFNKFLSVFGITGGSWIGIGANYWKAMFVLVIFNVWHGLAFKIMVFLSAIESIDKQYYQAAQIDKTPKVKQFFRITLPLISPTVFYIVITSLIGSFKTYTSVIAIFGKTGAPTAAAYNLKTIVFFIYDFFATPDLIPQAAAGSIILFVIILLFTIVQIQVSKRRVHY